MYDYYDYDDKSIDEILESMVIDINNLFNEMDITIIKANYIYLRENGEEMPPNKRAKVAGEVKEGILKKVWNRITDSVKAAKDWITKKLNGEKDYTKEELEYMKKGFDILVKDKTIRFKWDYSITPALILHKPIISDGLVKTLMKIRPNDPNYKDKFIECGNKIRKPFARVGDGQDLPVMIKKQDLLTYVKNEKNIIRSNESKLDEMFDQLEALCLENEKIAPKDFLSSSIGVIEDSIFFPYKFIKDTNTYFNSVAKACIRLGKAAKDKSSSTNESYMFDTFDDLYY